MSGPRRNRPTRYRSSSSAPAFCFCPLVFVERQSEHRSGPRVSTSCAKGGGAGRGKGEGRGHAAEVHALDAARCRRMHVSHHRTTPRSHGGRHKRPLSRTREATFYRLLRRRICLRGGGGRGEKKAPLRPRAVLLSLLWKFVRDCSISLRFFFFCLREKLISEWMDGNISFFFLLGGSECRLAENLNFTSGA